VFGLIRCETTLESRRGRNALKGVDVAFLAEIALGVHFGLRIAKSMSEAEETWVEYARVLREAGGFLDDDDEPSNMLLFAWVKFSFIIPVLLAFLCTAIAFTGSLFFGAKETGIDRDSIAMAVSLSIFFSGSAFRMLADGRAKIESLAVPVKKLFGASMVVLMALLGGVVSFFAYEGVAYALFALATTMVVCTACRTCGVLMNWRKRSKEFGK